MTVSSSDLSLEHPAARRTALRRLLVAVAAAASLAGCAGPPAPPPPAPPPAPPERGLTLAQKTALRDLEFTESPDDWNLDLGARLPFGVDATTITPAGEAALARVAQTLLSVGIDHLTVEGHADNVGNEAHNQRLSERRAEVIAEALAAHGFTLANITRRGYGSTRPVASNATAASRSQNRRAVLIVPSL
jgi:outer membrane protein OmpA-like peptidoglycan-associated protein